ncbi:molecular chaperone [Kalamiella sp. sgz302252]|uniref:fimbrial biogenesis chaperone n=1 Tax=Pantoea sp. sgz302252 TaxID=3341827 RepID=UPI0036D3AE01
MRKTTLFFILMLAFGLASAHAGVIIGGSRMVYEGNEKEKAISVENPDAFSFLIQSWIEDATGNMIKDNAPFIVTPPLFRLDGKQKNLLRIIRTENSLPQDRETLLWLNIKSIPAKSDTEHNTLQIAVRTRLKLIFRPESLVDETPEQHVQKLEWKKKGNQLVVINPSKYLMNFMFIRINNKKVVDGGVVMPESSAAFDLPSGETAGEISWKLINDYGGTGPVHLNKI